MSEAKEKQESRKEDKKEQIILDLVENQGLKKEYRDEIEPKELVRYAYPREIYREAVIGLTLITIFGIIGIIILNIFANNAQIDGLVSITSAAVGGLVVVFSQRASSGD
jgi:hypothetical protein